MLFNTLLAGAEGCAPSQALTLFWNSRQHCEVCSQTVYMLAARLSLPVITAAAAYRLDEDLIQREAKHVGSRQFGMCYFAGGGMASVGTILRIDTHVHHPDGRIFVVSQGVLHQLQGFLCCSCLA